MSIGERLRERRTLIGLTLGQVAEYENVSKGYISELERGVKSPNVWPLLAKLACRYGCSTDYLLGLTDDPTPAGEVSPIQLLFERLSEERQADLLTMARMYLAEENADYRGAELLRLLEEFADEEVEGMTVEQLLRRLVDEASALEQSD